MLPWLQNNQFPLYLAPMARYTDTVYRQLCKREGADVVVTEFVMAESVLADEPQVWENLHYTEDQRPIGMQIFGSNPKTMAEAAQLLEHRLKPDFIDLNFGCPAEKVTCQDAGASLLKNPSKLIDIVESVVDAVPGTPVTAKIRLGWDDQNIVAMDIARELQNCRVGALTIHGRTKVQGYSGEGRWEIIREIAERVELPIIGNGNVKNSRMVKDIRDNTAIAGVMIGRAALGYPWIFNEIKQHLETGTQPPPPDIETRWNTIVAYAELLSARPARQHHTEQIKWMRPRLIKLTKDMRGSKKLRHDLQNITYLHQLREVAADQMKKELTA